MDRFRQQIKYEEEGVAAAQEGKRREDCPYPKEDDEAWNFWVYGNENEQGRMVTDYMRLKGIQAFYMSTGDLTPEMTKALEEWSSAYRKAEDELRKEKGWK